MVKQQEAETKERTTSQLWARRESIKRKIAELQREEAEISETLKHALETN